MMPNKNSVPANQWDQAQDAYELGFMNARQIGERLGVSRQTVTREMERRGAVKASRVHETIADLNALWDRQAAERRRQESKQWDARFARATATTEIIDSMMNFLLEADRSKISR